MRPVRFAQYLRPDGRTSYESIDRPDNIAAMAARLFKCGHRFTAEVLVTGEVSLACEHRESGDIAIVVVPNGPGVVEAVDELVTNATETVFGSKVPD